MQLTGIWKYTFQGGETLEVEGTIESTLPKVITLNKSIVGIVWYGNILKEPDYDMSDDDDTTYPPFSNW